MSIENTPFAESNVMPKRQKNKTISKKIPILVGGVVLVAVVLSFIVGGFVKDDYRTLEAFDVEDYLENYERVLGGVFVLNGQVDAVLGSESKLGKLLSVKDVESDKFVAVMLPHSVAAPANLRKGQKLKMEITVGDAGAVIVNKLEKQ